MKNVITIAIALTTLAAGWLLGKHFGDVQYIEKPVEVWKVEYKDTCVTMVKVDGKLRGVKPGMKKVIAQSIPEPTVIKDSLDTRPVTEISFLQGEYNIAPKLFKFEHKDSLLHIQEFIIVRGDIIDFNRSIKLDTPLVAASPIKPTILADIVEPAIRTFTNPTYNPNLGKGAELNIMLGGLYNFKPELDAMGGYTVGANVRFEGGSTIGLTYSRITNVNYAGVQMSLPVLKFRR